MVSGCITTYLTPRACHPTKPRAPPLTGHTHTHTHTRTHTFCKFGSSRKDKTVLSWVLFTGLMSYVRVEIANQMREEGQSALFWCGAVTQVGSAIGAVVMFVLVNVYFFFTPYIPC
ncbi:Solute carrier family 52, riboflavin transporter, member 3 [Portunus trituberculatus]|uniref:Riboflavin transporter n=1 Tax=Portunus trituberculatus TaxID=210409 RepID=A0A5B7IX23_PORTR|nr:Solute carrier family 52, riboflavin transporter, member 3 [Portunus trituberculatus]